MEIPPRDDGILEHQRIIRGTIQLNREDSFRLGERVPRRSVHLWNAAQAVRILYAAALSLGSWNSASFQQRSEMLCTQHLSRVWSCRVQSWIERRRCSAKG